ncbi:Protein of unknown function [Cotesia congregata]|uniref:Uncharacterized protein n=1 Tax=Cotesia congregata TaxID=51543 RepID=A0A8J2H458_COTCN|nr:Protein of unknown function [Cotesia congregata]
MLTSVAGLFVFSVGIGGMKIAERFRLVGCWCVSGAIRFVLGDTGTAAGTIADTGLVGEEDDEDEEEDEDIAAFGTIFCSFCSGITIIVPRTESSFGKSKTLYFFTIFTASFTFNNTGFIDTAYQEE